MRQRIGRTMGATSVVALIVIAATTLGGISTAVAATFEAHLVQSVDTSDWSPPSGEPSGVTQLPGGRLLVVDTNFNEPDSNGWVYTLATGQVTNRATGVAEPTGVDHDPATNTLFITSDDNDGQIIAVIRNFDTPTESRTTIDTEELGSGDTEDPAFDETEDILYFVDGSDSRIYRIDPGSDQLFGTTGDVVTSYSIEHLNPNSNRDWEGLAWDPASGNLLVGNRLDMEIYEINKLNGALINTFDATGIPGLDLISGLGTAPSTTSPGQRSIWVTDRATSTIFELSIDGSATTTTTTTPATTTTTAPATTTSTAPATTTSTGPATTTTTAPATTTTTGQGATTTTTVPGSTTTTTQPGSTTTTTIPGTTTTTTTPPPPVPQTAESAVVQTNSGFWRLFRGTGQVAGFFFGNPGDYGFMGDWNCDGIDTPGLYRRSDGYVYLRNSNTQGPADIAFFFGNPGDLPLAGDFDGNGCDTVSIYRPAEGRFFIMNHLGVGDAGLGAADFSFFFGNPGDAPFMGDWDGDGIDTPGLRRNSNGFVYLRHTNSAGPGQIEYFYGDAGDVVFTGDWDGDGDDTLGLYRPSNGNMYLRNANSTGTADHTVAVGTGMQPFGGNF